MQRIQQVAGGVQAGGNKQHSRFQHAWCRERQACLGSMARGGVSATCQGLKAAAAAAAASCC